MRPGTINADATSSATKSMRRPAKLWLYPGSQLLLPFLDVHERLSLPDGLLGWTLVRLRSPDLRWSVRDGVWCHYSSTESTPTSSGDLPWRRGRPPGASLQILQRVLYLQRWGRNTDHLSRRRLVRRAESGLCASDGRVLSPRRPAETSDAERVPWCGRWGSGSGTGQLFVLLRLRQRGGLPRGLSAGSVLWCVPSVVRVQCHL